MIPMHERPLAMPGFTSYRLRGPHGWVMLAGTDDADAMREAARSTDSPDPEALEKWNAATGRYEKVSNA